MRVADSERALDVSRETQQRLECFVALLERWTPKINLVAKSTLPSLWSRHVSDSAQLMQYIPETARHYVDLGSGGGFPGLVIGIIAAERIPDLAVTLVESDVRKATFLRTVLRETGIPGQVLSQRAEAISPLDADIITARALAELPHLLSLASRHLRKDGVALLQKGSAWKQEVAAAHASWTFSMTCQPSITDVNAVILRIGDIAHV